MAWYLVKHTDNFIFAFYHLKNVPYLLTYLLTYSLTHSMV
jgi:hypothetical protein